MSRDHYKGVPKTRDAVVLADGSVVPLSNKEESALSRFSTLSADFNDDPTNITYIVARSTGSDATGDGSLGNPYRTFVRCLDDLPTVSDGSAVVIDITGIGEEVTDKQIVIPPFLGMAMTELSASPNFLRTDYHYRTGLSIVATPTLVQAFTPTGSSSDATTGRKSLTLAGAGWAPDEHKGKFLIGSGQYETAVIVGNTEDTLTITVDAVYAGEVSIVEPSATLVLGYESNPSGVLYAEGLSLRSVKSDVLLSGVAFKKSTAAGTSVDLGTQGRTIVELCSFEGMYDPSTSMNQLLFYGCYFPPGFTVDHGLSQTNYNGCFFDSCHKADWSGGPVAHYECTFLGMTDPVGVNARYNHHRIRGNHTYERCTITSGTDGGIKAYDTRIVASHCDISDCTGDAIFISKRANFVLRYCIGSGNTGYGIRAEDGAHVETRSPAITGDSGDFKIGILTEPTIWADYTSQGSNMVCVNSVSGTLSRMYAV
jgi:hypothetical protein